MLLALARVYLTQRAHDTVANGIERYAIALQHARRDAFAFANQAEQQMLRTDVVVVQTARRIHAQLDHPLRAQGKVDVANPRSIALAHNLHDRLTHSGEVDSEADENLRCHSVRIPNESQQQMFGADVVVAVTPRLFLSPLQHQSGRISQLVEAIRSLARCHAAATGSGLPAWHRRQVSEELTQLLVADGQCPDRSALRWR